MSNVNIPPDIAAVFEDFWEEMLLEQFGPTPPSPAEEAAYIQEFLDQGVLTVPMPDGSRVDVVADGSVDLDALGGQSGAMGLEKSGSALSDVPAWQIVLFGAVALLIFWPLIGRPIRNTIGGIFGGSGDSDGEESSVEIELPEGIDSLVKSGDVKAPLVTPRTLEIQPNNVTTATTFVVVPVEVKEADWPCPSKKFKDQPAACWVFGTVVNYIVGIPSDGGAAAVFADLQANGGDVRLRMSTEKVLHFTIDEVRQIERHQTEVLGQHHFGLTLVALRGDGAKRYVARASYVPREISFAGDLANEWAEVIGAASGMPEDGEGQPTAEGGSGGDAAELYPTFTPTGSGGGDEIAELYPTFTPTGNGHEDEIAELYPTFTPRGGGSPEASPAPTEDAREEATPTVRVWASPAPAGTEGTQGSAPSPTPTDEPRSAGGLDDQDVTHAVTLGERVDLSDMVSIVPTDLSSDGGGNVLTIKLENQGALPYTPSWAVRAETADGEVVTDGIRQEGDQITIRASAPASVWMIRTSGKLIRIDTQNGGNS